MKAVWERKQALLDKAKKANSNYALAIYEGVSKGESLRDLIRRIRRIKALNLRMGLPHYAETERYAESVAKKISKQTPQAVVALHSAEALATYCLAQLQRLDALKGFSKIAYAKANEQEAKDKQGVIEGMLGDEDPKDGDKPLTARVFYLCSWHGDCAEDHEGWQGKLYYDRFWRRHVKGKEAQRRVLDFIESHELMSLQWVTNKPVWLMTRPNCRHYFEQVTAEEAFAKSADALLDERGMRTEHGERGTNQTIRHSTQKGWYTEENIKNIIQKYKERLELHQRMYEIQPNEKLKGYIDKDKRLIKKWRYMLGKK